MRQKSTCRSGLANVFRAFSNRQCPPVVKVDVRTHIMAKTGQGWGKKNHRNGLRSNRRASVADLAIKLGGSVARNF